MNPSIFENHLVFEKLEQFFTLLAKNEIREKIEIEKLNFFDSSIKYIKDRISITIPILVQEAELNTISQEIENAFAQINTFIGNNNIGHLNNAEGHLTTSMVRIRNLPLPFSKSDFNFSKMISNFEETVNSKYKTIEEKNISIKEELTKLKSDLAIKENDLKIISELLSLKNTEINNLNTSFQNNYNTFQTSSNQNFENDRKSFRDQITKDRETFRKEIDEKINTIDTRTSDLVDSTKQKLNEAKKLVNVIGNVGVTGNYQNIANDNKTAANILRVVAIIFMTIFSGLLIYTIWDIHRGEYDPIKSLIRIIAAAALSYPATYAARESSKHRRLETINRKLELELSSLTPFIELLPPEKQNEIKTKLVEKYFGNNLDIAVDKNEKEEEVSISGFDKILKAILPFIKK